MPAVRRALPVVLLAVAMASADPPASQPADVWQRIASPDYAVREAATDELWRQGEAARPALAAAAETATPDVQERCRRVLWLLNLGLTPDLPQPALDAIANYDYAAPAQEKARRLGIAQQAGGAAAKAVLRLALDEPLADVRRRVYGNYGADAVGAYARRLIDGGDDTLLQKLAEAFAGADNEGGMLTLAMVLADEDGRLDADTVDFEKQAGNARVATNFSRRRVRQQFALGRTADAIAAADALSAGFRQPSVALKLRIAAGDFAGVLKSADPARTPHLRAAALAVTGDEAGARAAAAELVAARADADAIVRRQTARLCLLLGLVPEGVDGFAKLGEVRVLAVQGRWAEALDLVAPNDNGGEAEATNAPRLRLPGEKDDLRRAAGLLPPQPVVRVAETGAAVVALQAAAGHWLKGDVEKATGAVAAALPPLRASEAQPETAVSMRAAALLLRAACYDKQSRPADATADRRLARRYAATGERVWVGVIERLDTLGLDTLADAEAERFGRFRPDGDWVAATLCERDARRATRRGDFAAAALARDKQLLWHAVGLGSPVSGVGYTESVGYLRGPYLRELAHARLELANGKRAAAVERLKRATSYQPTDGALAIEFVPKLDVAGDTAAGDALFDAVYDRQKPLIDAYPKAAQVRNTAAWTMLRTGRRTGEALKLSAEAVALRPDEAAYWDTYAEALFVAGQKDAAIDAMRRAAKLLPDDPVTRVRLAGFEKGKIMVPDEPE